MLSMVGKVKILVNTIPEQPEDCPFSHVYIYDDWKRYDCRLRGKNNPLLYQYTPDYRKRKSVESKCHCYRTLGKECPYLKPISAVLPQ